MTTEQFRKLAVEMFGQDRGWQSRVAEALGTDRSSVTRWLSGQIAVVPGPVAAAMRCWHQTWKSTGRKAWEDAPAR